MSAKGQTPSPLPVGRSITRADLQSKLDEINAELTETVDGAKQTGQTIAIGAIVVVVVLAFVFGRRRGKKTSTVVTVRRI